MTARNVRIGLAVALVLVLIAAVVVVLRSVGADRPHPFAAYFDNSNGIFAGDEVRILGVPVGKIDTIEPQPQRAKITFWVDDAVQGPRRREGGDPVTAAGHPPRHPTDAGLHRRARDAPTGAVIPQDRTAVPVEWDDFRATAGKAHATACNRPSPAG